MSTEERKIFKSMPPENGFESFLKSPSKEQWEKIGLQKRSGVCTPLFSIYSKESAGIGEIPDLMQLIDWCKKCGMSIIQLLPLNDVGLKFTPYDTETSFALDPMYLSFKELKGVSFSDYESFVQDIQKRFPSNSLKVDYGVKEAKLEIFWKIFKENEFENCEAFQKFCDDEAFWLNDYCLYKVLKEKFKQASWEEWDEKLKFRDEEALDMIQKLQKDRIDFYKWLQWQLFTQFEEVKAYAASKQVFLMGDLPFLVSRDSVDVWSHQDYFKLNLTAGAPPDAFFALGQRWGMPPYDWEKIAAADYDYLRQKLKIAERFYDMFRVDHAVGLFRIWTIDLSEPLESGGLKGKFDPEDEETWEAHGKRLLDVILESSSMLPCAEDLGVVPECSNKVLKEYSLPGMEIQRWKRDWGNTYEFTQGEAYRLNGIAIVSTHDMTPFKVWWHHEIGKVDDLFFELNCKSSGVDYEEVKAKIFDAEKSVNGKLAWCDDVADVHTFVGHLNIPEEAWLLVDMFKTFNDEVEKYLLFLGYEGKLPTKKNMHQFTKQVLEKVNQSSSIFSIQLLQDWLSCDKDFAFDSWESRINVPGSMGDHNWSLRMPWSLEEMLKRPVCEIIYTINTSSHRI